MNNNKVRGSAISPEHLGACSIDRVPSARHTAIRE